jgi:rare lipoprotein A
MTCIARSQFGWIGWAVRQRKAEPGLGRKVVRLLGRTLLIKLGLLLTGCAASPEPGAVEETPLASGRPRVRAVVPVSPPKPAPPPPARRERVVLKPLPPLPQPAPVPLAELWEGKGKCEGVASFYAGKFLGRRTANGEVYTGRKLTAAHRVLAFGTYVKVTNLENGLDVIVRINDRGPFIAGRVIDLSPAAARKLHMTRQGVAKVRLETVAAWMAE